MPRHETSGSFQSTVKDGKKRCPRCGEIKPLEAFGFRRSYGKVYPESRCCPCRTILSRLWVNKNAKNKRKAQKCSSAWAKKNKSYFAEWARTHRIKNGEKVRERNRARHKIRREIDPQYKLGCALRSRIHSALRRQKSKKSSKAETLLGCSVAKLKEHIESQFEPWMTWENHGLLTWNIDHIIPCSHFDLTDPIQQAQCFNWRNLRPLSWEENIKKSNKILFDKESLLGNICPSA